MVDEVDARRRGGKAPQMIRVERRACRGPRARCELLPLLPFGHRPDVLRVGRAAPGQPAHHRRVPGHRRRRVEEMRMQVYDVGGQLGSEHQRLSEAAQRGCAEIAAEVAPPGRACRAIARGPPRACATRARRGGRRGAGTPAGTFTGARISACSGCVARRSDAAARTGAARSRAARARAAPAR